MIAHDADYVDGSQAVWGDGFGPQVATDVTAYVNVTDAIDDGTNGTPRVASETRPINVSVVWLMKVSPLVEQVAVPPGTGSALGGSAAVGGVDFSFTGASAGTFTASRLTTAFDDASQILDAPGTVNFALPSDPVQFWELGFDAAFTSASLTFGYDDADFASFFDEGSLLVYHYVEPFGGCTPGADCEWVPLPVTARDTVANTITVTTTGFSQFLLGGPALSGSQIYFSGTAQGGGIELTVGAVALAVTTTASQSSLEVAQAVADAINADPTLVAAGISATTSARLVVVSNGVVVSVSSSDPGIGVSQTVVIPALPAAWAGLLAAILGLALGGRQRLAAARRLQKEAQQRRPR